MDKGRFVAFSDGVFAFAITLLVLAFAVPLAADGSALAEGKLIGALLALWPSALAYLLSFFVIGIMWQNHQALFRTVEQIDRMTVAYNLMLLLFTVLIPFATQLLGHYEATRTATLLYGVVLTCCSTCYNLILGHLVEAKCFSASVGATAIRKTVVAFRIGWCTYVAATLVSLLFPLAAFALYLAIAIYYLIPHGLDSDLDATAS